MAKTCKSYGVAIHSGERVSNESLMYPGLWDSRSKDRVIPDDMATGHPVDLKGKPVWVQAISYQLVGGVTAHQGDDA